MITEHNFQKLYLLKAPATPDWLWLGGHNLEIETNEEEAALVFLHPKDAERWRKLCRRVARVVEIELPYRLEYDAGVIWQWKRYYRTSDVALAGFKDYMARARSSSLADHVWRVIDLITGNVVIEAQPDNYADAEIWMCDSCGDTWLQHQVFTHDHVFKGSLE